HPEPPSSTSPAPPATPSRSNRSTSPSPPATPSTPSASSPSPRSWASSRRTLTSSSSTQPTRTIPTSMVMDLCPNSDLHALILANGGVFAENEARSILAQFMTAVSHCHRKGVIHGDNKPDNVLFDSWNLVKLADIGSAEVVVGGEAATGIVGTSYYVAPEVLSGWEYGEKVDVWSAGVVLYIMLAGRPPFYGEMAVEIFDAVLRANHSFPPRVFLSVSPKAKDLLRRMLCKDVYRRFSAEQVLRHPWMTSGGGT
ncbi:unnamed protein product, partial [Linum tenue]